MQACKRDQDSLGYSSRNGFQVLLGRKSPKSQLKLISIREGKTLTYQHLEYRRKDSRKHPNKISIKIPFQGFYSWMCFLKNCFINSI